MMSYPVHGSALERAEWHADRDDYENAFYRCRTGLEEMTAAYEEASRQNEASYERGRLAGIAEVKIQIQEVVDDFNKHYDDPAILEICLQQKFSLGPKGE